MPDVTKEIPRPDFIAPTPATVTPPTPYTSWCAWAQDNLRKAMEGMTGATAGVTGYGIGTRWVRFTDAGKQAAAVDYWMKLVEFYCGVDALPSSLTGRDTAFRVIPRDI
jgi:hypothetical protein